MERQQLSKGLQNGTQYSFSVRANNLRGFGSASSPVTATPATVPDAPTDANVVSTGDGVVDLEWSAPSQNGGAAVSGYTVELSPGCVSCTGLSTTGTTTQVAGLTNGVNYSFKVSAANSQGSGAASSPVTARPSTTPGVPTNLAVASLGASDVSLNWDSPSSDGGSPVTQYQIDVSPTCVNCTGTTSATTNTNVRGLTNGTAYTFTVRAVNEKGSGGASASVTATPSTTPSVSRNLQTTSVTNQSVELSWDAPVDNGGLSLNGYSVQVAPPCSSCTGLSASSTSTNVSGLTNGVTYSFSVVANNADGASPSAAVVSARPFTTPANPTSVTVTAVAPQEVDLAWQAPTNDGGSPITGYEVTTSPPCSSCTGTTTAATSTAVKGLTNGVNYTFSVRSLNAGGPSPVAATTSAMAMNTPVMQAQPATVGSVSDRSVALSWPAATGDGITGYRVTVSPPCPSCTGLDTATNSTVVSGLSNGVSYSFTVAAINAQGPGP